MASRALRADRTSVTISAAPQAVAQQVFALLGHNGTGDLIDALLAQMDAYDGDTDMERDLSDLEDGDVDCCDAGDDDVQRGRGYSDDGLPGDPTDSEDGHDDERNLAPVSL